MAKTISLPVSVRHFGSDCYAETLNSMEGENLLADIEFEDNSVDLINWQLIKATGLNHINNLDFYPIITDEVVLCSLDEVQEDCRISLSNDGAVVSSIGDNDMMIVPVRLGLNVVSIVNGALLESKSLLDSGAHYNFGSEFCFNFGSNFGSEFCSKFFSNFDSEFCSNFCLSTCQWTNQDGFDGKVQFKKRANPFHGRLKRA